GNDNALLLELGYLAQQRMRVENHAVTDHRKLSRPDHARWQQGQLIGLAVNYQRMAGIMAALKTDHDVGLLGEPIDDLAFALVAPLRANHDDICHEGSVLKRPITTRMVRIPAAAARSDNG